MHKIDDDLSLREEKLHPDLQCYVRASPWEPGTFELHHPLFRTMRLDPQRAATENRKYELASAKVREAAQAGDWSRYAYWHERPYRFDALRRIAGKIESHKAFWNCQRRRNHASARRRDDASMMTARRPPNWGPFV
jgi:hypothetical protein